MRGLLLSETRRSDLWGQLGHAFQCLTAARQTPGDHRKSATGRSSIPTQYASSWIRPLPLSALIKTLGHTVRGGREQQRHNMYEAYCLGKAFLQSKISQERACTISFDLSFPHSSYLERAFHPGTSIVVKTPGAAAGAFFMIGMPFMPVSLS